MNSSVTTPSSAICAHCLFLWQDNCSFHPEWEQLQLLQQIENSSDPDDVCHTLQAICQHDGFAKKKNKKVLTWVL
jgi:hypothetical protein